jgi:hypothetical protein
MGNRIAIGQVEILKLQRHDDIIFSTVTYKSPPENLNGMFDVLV